MNFEKYQNTIDHLISHCGSFKCGEKLTIVHDHTTKEMAELFYLSAKKISQNTTLIETPLAKRHGEEPSELAREQMLSSNLIISLCRFSLAHSSARIEAGKKGARFLSMPLYTWQLLEDESTKVNYKQQSALVRKITDAFTNGSIVQVKTNAGTDIILNIKSRVGNYCPGFVEEAGDLGSPPDIESNISPIESSSNGIVVVDGSITTPEIGLLNTPVILNIKEGRVVEITSQNSNYIDILENIFQGSDSKRRVLAECGVGLNYAAKLTGTMLTDEGALGCIHFGFGSNFTLGGQNKVDFHLDFVFRNGTLIIDDKKYLENGQLV